MRILVFDIGGTLIKSAMFEPNHTLSNYCEHSYPFPGREGIESILNLCLQPQDFDAVGISTAGLVDEQKGEILYCSDSIPNYSGMKLADYIQQLTGRPAFLMNDVNAAAYGECHFGVGKGFCDFICLTYGTSIGGAIVINNKIYSGSHGFAGEVGHIPTHWNGKLCTCGLHGCYSEYASTSVLVSACSAINPSIHNGRDVFAQLQVPEVKREVDLWIDEIMVGLVTLCHIFNPPALVLGGGIMSQAYILDEIQRKLPSLILSDYRDVQVLSAKLGNQAGLMGSAYNALERMMLRGNL